MHLQRAERPLTRSPEAVQSAPRTRASSELAAQWSTHGLRA